MSEKNDDRFYNILSRLDNERPSNELEVEAAEYIRALRVDVERLQKKNEHLEKIIHDRQCPCEKCVHDGDCGSCDGYEKWLRLIDSRQPDAPTPHKHPAKRVVKKYKLVLVEPDAPAPTEYAVADNQAGEHDYTGGNAGGGTAGALEVELKTRDGEIRARCVKCGEFIDKHIIVVNHKCGACGHELKVNVEGGRE